MDFFLGITNKCNLNCYWCAHKHLRNLNINYEMSKKEFETWLFYTKKSGYFFDCIDFNGLGEPTCYPDLDFFRYMLIKCKKIASTVNILTNGVNINILQKILYFCDHISVSVWNNTNLEELEKLQSEYFKKIHLKKNIIKHKICYPIIKKYTNINSICGCCGCGYTMNTVFLLCGTWCPKIIKNDVYHTELKEYYLSTLNKNELGLAIHNMCKECYANTSIPYTIYYD